MSDPRNSLPPARRALEGETVEDWISNAENAQRSAHPSPPRPPQFSPTDLAQPLSDNFQTRLRDASQRIQARIDAATRGHMRQAGPGAKITDLAWGLGAGVAKAGFEAKDFILGETPTDDRSSFRQNIEREAASFGRQSPGMRLVTSVGQIAASLAGAGKIIRPIQAVKRLRGGTVAFETARGALPATSASTLTRSGSPTSPCRWDRSSRGPYLSISKPTPTTAAPRHASS